MSQAVFHNALVNDGGAARRNSVQEPRRTEPEHFRSICCRRLGCPEAEFEDRVLSHCLYRHARWLAPVLQRINPAHFALDLELVRWCATATTVPQFVSEMRAFPPRNRRRGFMRGLLRVRLSAGRLIALASECLDPARPQ